MVHTTKPLVARCMMVFLQDWSSYKFFKEKKILTYFPLRIGKLHLSKSQFNII